MNESNVIILGDYIEPEIVDFEGTLSFNVKASYIEKKKIWQSKDITAEFFGNFWENIVESPHIKSTLHFICAELMENAVYHSTTPDYMIRIQLCFKSDELMVYSINSADTKNNEEFISFIRMLLETENLQKLFIQRMKEAKKSRSKKSQVGLITMIKDRGAKLAWKLVKGKELTKITTQARILLKNKETV